MFSAATKCASLFLSTANYVTQVSSTANASSYTFSGVDIGTATSNRLVVVCASGGSNTAGDITGISIGGNAANLIAKTTISDSEDPATVMYGLLVTSGTSADIVVTFASTKNRCQISVYDVKVSSTTAVSTTTDNDNSNPATASVNVKYGNSVIAITSGNNSTTVSWSGLSEDMDVALENNQTTSTASLNARTNGSVSISASFASSPSRTNLVVAVFK